MSEQQRDHTGGGQNGEHKIDDNCMALASVVAEPVEEEAACRNDRGSEGWCKLGISKKSIQTIGTGFRPPTGSPIFKKKADGDLHKIPPMTNHLGS